MDYLTYDLEIRFRRQKAQQVSKAYRWRRDPSQKHAAYEGPWDCSRKFEVVILRSMLVRTVEMKIVYALVAMQQDQPRRTERHGWREG